MRQAKRRILFVDGDPYVLSGYQRAVIQYETEWEASYVSSGMEAIALLSRIPFDILFTDVRLPDLSGAKLLEMAHRQFPGVIRVVLSGNLEDQKSLQLTTLAHQFLPKTVDSAQIMKLAGRMCQMREMLSNPNLMQVITGVKALPSLPGLYLNLVEYLNREEPLPRRVAEIISQDVSMTAKILHLVNSAFFGLSGEVTNIQRAVSMLGINTIKALVLGIHVFSEYENLENPWIPIRPLWMHSIITGNIARMIATDLGMNQRAQDDAQVAGLLHDIGKLIQLKIPNFFNNILVRERKISLETEYRVYGTSHAEVGAYLLGIWGLPYSVIEAVGFHHIDKYDPLNIPNNIASIVHIANKVSYLARQESKVNIYEQLGENYLQNDAIRNHLDDWYQFASSLYFTPRID